MLQNTTVSKNSQYLVLADHMSKNAKVAWGSLIGLVGLIVLLGGLCTHAYGFFVGLIIAIACWVGGAVS
jgi:tetrahydromethanopterin S-methyltransferase subunit B